MNLALSRREFLNALAASASVLVATGASQFLLSPAWASDMQEFILLCESDEFPPIKIPRVTPVGYAKALNVKTKETFRIEMPFSGHTLTQNPHYPNFAASFEKWGYQGCLVDLKEQTLVASGQSSDDNIFFGHGAFVGQGKTLVAAENNEAKKEGFLSVRDAFDLKILDNISSGGGYPHDIKTVDEHTILVINEGKAKAGRSNLSWVDIPSGKILHQVHLDAGPGVYFKHLEMSFDKWICVAGYQNGAVGTSHAAMISPKGEFLPLPTTPEMTDEVLSIVFLGKSGIVAGTMPLSDLVAFWDYRMQKLLGTVTVSQHPTGLLYDVDSDRSGQVIISTYEGHDLVTAQAASVLQPKTDVEGYVPDFGGIGSHLSRAYL